MSEQLSSPNSISSPPTTTSATEHVHVDQHHQQLNPIDTIIQTFHEKCKQFKQHIQSLTTTSSSTQQQSFTEGYNKLLELQSLQIQIQLYQKRMNDLRIDRKKEMELPLLECNNLQCEASYFQRDVSLCRHYYSKHVEIIDLMPSTEQFKIKAPTHYVLPLLEYETLLKQQEKHEKPSEQGLLESKSESSAGVAVIDNSNSSVGVKEEQGLLLKKQHEIMMKRLTYELDQREELEQQIQTIKQQQEATKQEQLNIEKVIHNIPKNLALLKKTIQQFEPVTSLLSSTCSELSNNGGGGASSSSIDWFSNEEIELMNQLPTPLYILYNKLMEYKRLHDDTIMLSIVGDSDRAKTVWNDLQDDHDHHQHHEDISISNTTNTNTTTSSSNTTQIDEDETIVVVGDNSTTSYEPKRKKLKTNVIETTNTSNMCSIFPLVIQLRVQLKFMEKNKKLLIEFSYLHQANLVVVNESRTAALVLPSLIEGDDGSISPNIQILPNYDFSNFERGRPYQWLQQLCGLNFIGNRQASSQSALDNRPPLSSKSSSVSSTMSSSGSGSVGGVGGVNNKNNYSLSYILNLFKYKQKAKRYLLNQLKSMELTSTGNNSNSNNSNLISTFEFPKCFSFSSPKLELFKQIDISYISITFQLLIRIQNLLFECELFVNVVDYPLKCPQFRKLKLKQSVVDSVVDNEIPIEYQSITCKDDDVDELNQMNDEDCSWSNLQLYQIEKDVNFDYVLKFNKKFKYQQSSSTTSTGAVGAGAGANSAGASVAGLESVEHFNLISHQLCRLMTDLAVYVELKTNLESTKAFDNSRRVLIGKYQEMPLHYDSKSNVFRHLDLDDEQ